MAPPNLDTARVTAEVLREARATRRPIAPVRNVVADPDIDWAYSVQRINIDAAVGSGERVSGYKVGLTSRAVQQQLGVNQPDFGALLATWEVPEGGLVELASLLQPRIEAEVAFVLKRNIDGGVVGAADVLRSTAFVLPALEIVDSAIVDWDISIIDTVADNASSGRFVLGPAPTPLTKVDLRDVTMTLMRGSSRVSSGSGEACLGHPVNAVVWLANTLNRLGTPLRAGDVVLSGALGPMVPVVEPSTFEADLSGLGRVTVEFA